MVYVFHMRLDRPPAPPLEDWSSNRMLSADERGRRLVECLRLMDAVLRGRPDRARVLAFQEPLPESTVIALRRLRAAYAARRPEPRQP